MNGTKWDVQFAIGFPIAGRLIQSRDFPLGESITADFVGPSTLFEPNTARFRARAPRAVSKHAETLWAEALQQVMGGWLAPPEAFNAEGGFAASPQDPCNLAFRFGVSRTDKLRGCGDLCDSLTNTACTIRTPITLHGWGHIAAASRILAENRCPWLFGKVDHRSAWKAAPICMGDDRFDVIALWNPADAAWYGFRTRSLLFGSTAAALRNNFLSRIIDSVLCRLLVIPTFGYFDDFGFFTRSADERETMEALTKLLTLI